MLSVNIFSTVIMFALLFQAAACNSGGNKGDAAPSLISIVVTPSNNNVPMGDTWSFTASGRYTDNSVKDLTSSTTWSSSNAAIASINSAGVATAVSAGTVTITATSGSVSGSTSLIVTSALPNSIDADGFLWGTEGSVLIQDSGNITGTTTTIRDSINSALKTKYVKIRPQNNYFASLDGGVTYAPSGCMPGYSSCQTPFNLDETVKLFKANGWSMVPMFTYDRSAGSVTTADIDRFVNFVSWFVDRCKADAGIQYIELEDFPASWWQGTNAQLLEMTNKVYDRIKASHPGVQVGTPGFEYWSDTLDATTSKAIAGAEYFLNPVNGAKFDYWAFHGYALTEVLNQGFAFYPPTRTAVTNKYAGVPGILNIRAALDANGWQGRPIIDTEHFGVGKTIFTDKDDLLDAAYLVQHDLLERTLQTAAGVPALSGVLSLKIFPRGSQLSEHGALNSDGSLSRHVKAVGLLRDKLRDYHYSSRISGSFDDESQVWVEKFQSGNKELYVFFKPFRYVQGNTIMLDGQTLNYSLTLPKTPISVVLTDISGSTSTVPLAQTLNLAGENSPKFLEVTYP